MLSDFSTAYAGVVPLRISQLYDDDPEWGEIFSILHRQLNIHFEGVNSRIGDNYWAQPSRDLIALLDRVDELLAVCMRAGVEVEVKASYKSAMARVRPHLVQSYGSPIPSDFERILVENYVPVFTRSTTSVTVLHSKERAELKEVGNGSYAVVYAYVDPLYGDRFAVKRARKNLGERDLVRFRAEYDLMKRLDHPNFVRVYKFEEEAQQYRMEYCDETLRDFIAKRNGTLASNTRKSIARQFLKAISYLHAQNLLHRDLSLQNVLVKTYKSGDVLVKVADFGLVKDLSKAFTQTHTALRGTIVDPLLADFRSYSVQNEMYAIAHLLSYIVTGRQGLMPKNSPLGLIVQKCASLNVEERFDSVAALLEAIEAV